MPDSTNTVDQARKMLEERRSELQAEIADIDKALSALGGKVTSSSRRRTASTSRGRSRRTGTAAPSRRRRRSSGGTRSDQAVKLITDNPGLSASEIASRLGIKPNYMYRVLSELEGESKVKKDGRKYYPAKGAAASS